MRVIQAACDKLPALIKSGDAAVKKQARRSFVCLFSCFITDVATYCWPLVTVGAAETNGSGRNSASAMQCNALQQDVGDDEGISK